MHFLNRGNFFTENDELHREFLKNHMINIFTLII
jgi:hypothetical protein